MSVVNVIRLRYPVFCMCCKVLHDLSLCYYFRYHWTKDGEDLRGFSGINWLKTGSIEVKHPTRMHEGEYRCFASNPYGTAMSDRAVLRRAMLWSAPEEPVEDYNAHIGDSLKVLYNLKAL